MITSMKIHKPLPVTPMALLVTTDLDPLLNYPPPLMVLVMTVAILSKMLIPTPDQAVLVVPTSPALTRDLVLEAIFWPWD